VISAGGAVGSASAGSIGCAAAREGGPAAIKPSANAASAVLVRLRIANARYIRLSPPLIG
jgi:hypothetical protein